MLASAEQVIVDLVSQCSKGESAEARQKRRKLLRALIRQNEKRIEREEHRFDDIERSSKAPLQGQQHNHEVIDSEILAGFADPDEIENEDRISRYCDQEFMKSHPEKVAESNRVIEESEVPDFRDRLDDLDENGQMIDQIGSVPLQEMPGDLLQVDKGIDILIPKVPDSSQSVA